jgi:sugar/nucleoside kinase (ribokinase family)
VAFSFSVALHSTELDSNGAGDPFLSSVVFGMANGHEPKTALRIGAIMSGLCVTSAQLVCASVTRDLLFAEVEKHFGEVMR